VPECGFGAVIEILAIDEHDGTFDLRFLHHTREKE